MISYCDVDDVLAYGNSTSGNDIDILEEVLIPGYSRQVDHFCRMWFGINTYTTQKLSALIDTEGNLFWTVPVPAVKEIVLIAWKRTFRNSHSVDFLSSIDIEESPNGSVLTAFDRDYLPYRGKKQSVLMSYRGGWEFSEVPADFKLAMIRLVWWGYKLREAPVGKTAIPSLGEIVIPPSSWPKDIRDAFKPYKRLL